MDMIEVKTVELVGPALDWSIAQAEQPDGFNWLICERRPILRLGDGVSKPLTIWQPSIDWNQGGPLIDKYLIGINQTWGRAWCAHSKTHLAVGGTLLIAVCRAIVISKSGDTVQVPTELMLEVEN